MFEKFSNRHAETFFLGTKNFLCKKSLSGIELRTMKLRIRLETVFPPAASAYVKAIYVDAKGNPVGDMAIGRSNKEAKDRLKMLNPSLQ